MLLVAFQGWSIHRGRRSLHRTTGLANPVLFPVFTASLVMIVNVSAAGYQAGSPCYRVAGTLWLADAALWRAWSWGADHQCTH